MAEGGAFLQEAAMPIERNGVPNMTYPLRREDLRLVGVISTSSS